jgi:DNA invertase Pin-like site-specific DNA recombinase
MTKAFGYIRVSGKSQVEGDGFERQELAIRTYAKAHDIQVVRIFQEKGVTGTKACEDRPAFMNLMEALHSNGTKTVLIEKLDRLARDLMVQETIIADLKHDGFELVSVCEPDLCSSDPSRILFRQMAGAFAQYEKSMIVLKLKAARQRMKAKTGRCEGHKPYGAYPGESAVLARMIQLKSEGMTTVAIAKTLNSEGFKTRSSGAWLQPTVSKILRRS